MSPLSCSRSPELSAALKAGHLPSAWEPSLREHVESCRQCRDVLLISQSLRADRAQAMPMAQLASPQLLWWRAQLRRRNEALELLSKPTSVIGKLALLSTLIVVSLLALQGLRGDYLARWLSDVAGSSSSFWSTTSSWSILLPLSMIGALAFLGAFAVYLASEKS